MTLDTFNKDIVGWSGTVLFWMVREHCPVCWMMRPGVGDLARRWRRTVKFVEVVSTESIELVKQFDVHTLPLILIFKKGQQVHASEGAVDVRLLEQKLPEEES